MKRGIFGIGIAGCCLVAMGEAGCWVDMNNLDPLPSAPAQAQGSGGAGLGGNPTTGSSGSSTTSSGQGGSGGAENAPVSGTCGDGELNPSETCDDGNTTDADSCTPNCRCGITEPLKEANGNHIIIAFSPDDGPFKDHCYLRVRKKTTWNMAKSACEAYGLQLAILITPQELDLVDKKLFNNTSNSHWIGAERTDRSAPVFGAYPWSWKWLDGTTLSGADMNMWNNNEPNNSDNLLIPEELCVQVFQSTGQLNDENCDNAFYYLCRTPIP